MVVDNEINEFASTAKRLMPNLLSEFKFDVIKGILELLEGIEVLNSNNIPLYSVFGRVIQDGEMSCEELERRLDYYKDKPWIKFLDREKEIIKYAISLTDCVALPSRYPTGCGH